MALTDPAPALYERRPAHRSPEALARAHMPLVRKIAWHVHGRVSSAIEIEDLIQIGMAALVEAANCFEDRGHAFATYASVRIRGAMIDHLRRQATICRSAMTRRREFASVRQRLEGRFGREVSEAEMAAELDLDPADYRDGGERADDALEREDLQAALAASIKTLPEREAMVLQLYFVEEMNLEEIGQTLGIDAARVCQIKKAALDKVRVSLSDWD